MQIVNIIMAVFVLASSFEVNSKLELTKTAPVKLVQTETKQQELLSELIKPYANACERTNIPPKVALAIAKQESGLNPFAVNVEGVGYMPENKEEALEIIKEAEAAGSSYDVGLMQINNQWFPRLGISPESLLEPDKNITIGIQILSKEFERHGKGWNAVGYYHSPTLARGRAYSWNIYQLYHGEIEGRKFKAAEKTKRNSIETRGYNAKQEAGNKNLLNRIGIWRNPKTSAKIRLISFQIRSQGIVRLSSSKSGESASPTRTSQD